MTNPSPVYYTSENNVDIAYDLVLPAVAGAPAPAPLNGQKNCTSRQRTGVTVARWRTKVA